MQNNPRPEHLNLRVGDAVVTARALGQGRPIVLLHSLLADSTSFDPLAALLADTHRVILLDLRAQCADLKLPVLVLVGEQDEATPPAMAREAADLIPGARFTVLAGCAHVPQLQAPRQFLGAIQEFIAA